MHKERYKSLEEFKESLHNNGLKALDKIYLDYKDEFCLFAKKYGISEDDIQDLYQDSIIAFYENFLNGNLQTMTSSLKTYIFSIGKYSIYNKLKKSKKTISIERKHLERMDLEAIDKHYKLSLKTTKVKNAMMQLGEGCRRLLVLFYYHSYSINALQHELNYKNENVVRSHKSRCLRSLKDLIRKI